MTRGWRSPATLSAGKVFAGETIGETSGCLVPVGNWDSSWALTLGRRICRSMVSRQQRIREVFYLCECRSFARREHRHPATFVPDWRQQNAAREKERKKVIMSERRKHAACYGYYPIESGWMMKFIIESISPRKRNTGDDARMAA